MNADDMAYGAPDAPTSEELAELDNVDSTDDGPLGVLRRKLRALHHRGSQDTARHMQLAVADILQADEWERAAEEAATLRTQLAHWRTFAIHAESEHAAWKKTATELDDELRQLRIAVARAVPAMHSYASKNPKHIMHGALQDPCGVHAWLVDFGA